jgi:hypothetical protein
VSRDVAVNQPFLVGVLQAQGRLVHGVAGMGDRQWTAGLDRLRQVEALDVLHRQDEALADTEGRVGGVGEPNPVATIDRPVVEEMMAPGESGRPWRVEKLVWNGT